MSDLINGAKLLAKIRKRMTDTNQVIDYFDVAHFELSWIEKHIVKEMKANGAEKSTEPALHKHVVGGSLPPEYSDLLNAAKKAYVAIRHENNPSATQLEAYFDIEKAVKAIEGNDR